MTKYTLIRSKRKTLAVHITGDARVEVRAPLKLSQKEIESFLAAKSEWIAKTVTRISEQAEKRSSFKLGQGDKILYRGKEYPIDTIGKRRVGFDGESFFLPQSLSQEEMKAAAIKLYRELARSFLTQRTMYFSALMRLSPSQIGISSAKTRWGSCNTRGRINYSWRLILAPDEVIDYVVVHELSHLLQMNHSPRFWKTVEGVLPDYRSRKNGLADLQHRLSAEDWD